MDLDLSNKQAPLRKTRVVSVKRWGRGGAVTLLGGGQEAGGRSLFFDTHT
jgi:hypothetical protein